MIIDNGDIVRYEPTIRTIGSVQEHPVYGLRSGHVYQVLKILDGQYLVFFPGDTGSHFTNFKKLTEAFRSYVEAVIPFPPLVEQLGDNAVAKRFRIGEKVIFDPSRNDEHVLRALKETRFNKGDIFTVKAFDPDGLGLVLEEVTGGFPLGGDYRKGIPGAYFRPAEPENS
jgi:hypothetical protein